MNICEGLEVAHACASRGIPNPDKFIKEKIVDMIKKNAEEFWNDPKINSLFKSEGINSISEINIKSSLIQRFTAK